MSFKSFAIDTLLEDSNIIDKTRTLLSKNKFCNKKQKKKKKKASESKIEQVSQRQY